MARRYGISSEGLAAIRSAVSLPVDQHLRGPPTKAAGSGVGDRRVLRGADWFPDSVNLAQRLVTVPETRAGNFGIRLAYSVDGR